MVEFIPRDQLVGPDQNSWLESFFYFYFFFAPWKHWSGWKRFLLSFWKIGEQLNVGRHKASRIVTNLPINKHLTDSNTWVKLGVQNPGWILYFTPLERINGWNIEIKTHFRKGTVIFQPNLYEDLCSSRSSSRGVNFQGGILHHDCCSFTVKPAAVTAEALSALDTFLELPKGGWPKKLKLPKRNVHSKNHECQDEMMKDRSLVFFLKDFCEGRFWMNLWFILVTIYDLIHIYILNSLD